MGQEMLTVSQVADRLKVCKMTVYRLIHGGRLPATQVGKLYRIYDKDLQAYLREARTASGARAGKGREGAA